MSRRNVVFGGPNMDPAAQTGRLLLPGETIS